MVYPLVLNPFDAHDISVAVNSIQSGQFTMGQKVKDFETAFSKKVGSRFAVMTNSGSSANLISTFSFLYKNKNSLKRGDEVLVPAIGWSTTWAPLYHAGLKIKVVDIDPETLNVDFNSYKQAVTEKTKMIVTVSVLGNPLEFNKIESFCREKNIILLEDNCESIGATVDKRQCGTFGNIGTFSFFYSHHISTIEGGMAVTNDEELYYILLALRAHGWVRDLPGSNFLIDESNSLMREKYNFVLPGFNVRPIDLAGALGCSQLIKLDGIVEARRKNALLFQSMMVKHQNKFQVQVEKFGASSWYSFTLVLKSNKLGSRDKLIQHLKDYKIESRMITGGCLTLHPMQKYFEFSDFPIPIEAERVHNFGVFVANHAVDISPMLSLLDKALTEFRE